MAFKRYVAVIEVDGKKKIPGEYRRKENMTYRLGTIAGFEAFVSFRIVSPSGSECSSAQMLPFATLKTLLDFNSVDRKMVAYLT